MIERTAPGPTRRGTKAVLAALALFAACGGSHGPIDGDRAMAHVEKMVGIGPRPFGSEALKKTADYIDEQVKALGLQLLTQESVDARTGKTIRNLYCKLDGPDPNGPILMLGAHYDTKLADGLTGPEAAHNMRFVGAIDGAGGSSVLIELARAIKEQKDRKCNVWLYWIDAEESIAWEWDHDNELVGSKAFCKWLSTEKILPRVKAFVLIDLVGSKNWKVDKDGNSDKRLQDAIAKAAKDLGAEDRVFQFPTAAQIAEATRRGQNWGTTDDHNSFTNFGVPSVLLIDFANRIPGYEKVGDYQQWWHTKDDDLPAMDKDALAFYGNLVMQALPDLEAFCVGRK